MHDLRLTVRNHYWSGDRYRPDVRPEPGGSPATLDGQFAFAVPGRERGSVVLARDRLGINKLFFAIHESGRVAASNYIADLVERGVPPASVYSVPAGSAVEIDGGGRTLRLVRYYRPRIDEACETSLAEAAARIRAGMDAWFARLASQFRSRNVVVCLSGGLDSGLVAALAARHFPRLTAWTLSLGDGNGGPSEDAIFAQRLAAFLGIPWRMVSVGADDALDAVEPALVSGQDWRDFNVHCAIVNELLARAIESDRAREGNGRHTIVLTGDLMNEFVADYSPIAWRERTFYPLPRLSRGSLRLALVRGLDAGDREVGVFARHGLDVVQPWGLVADALLGVPSRLLQTDDAKQRLARGVGADLLPAWLFGRSKVRAQIGTSGSGAGLLAWLVDRGLDGAWLRNAFRRRMGIGEDAFLTGFIRGGAYRALHAFPHGRCEHGYLAG